MSVSLTLSFIQRTRLYPKNLETVAQCVTSKKQTIQQNSWPHQTRQNNWYIQKPQIADLSWDQVGGFRNLLIMNEKFFFRNIERELATESLCLEAERAVAETIVCLRMLRITVQVEDELNDMSDNKTQQRWQGRGEVLIMWMHFTRISICGETGVSRMKVEITV